MEKEPQKYISINETNEQNKLLEENTSILNENDIDAADCELNETDESIQNNIEIPEEIKTSETLDEMQKSEVINDTEIFNDSNNIEIPKEKNNVIKYLLSKEKRAVLKRAFHIWQIKPHELAPISDTVHTCASCGTEYKGNYCPRCGLSSSIGRFSFAKALLLFVDVWGLGNRSMFRSIRDLALRPGYMIRDYIGGMQTAYFPPFKMFFLFVALSLLVEHGFNFDLEGKNNQEVKADTEIVQQKNQDINILGRVNLKNEIDIKKEESPMYKLGRKFANMMQNLMEKNPAIFAFISLVLFSWPLFFFLRKCPNIPDLRFSEFIVALVYTSNSFTIFSIAGSLLDSIILQMLSIIIIFVSLHQFSGYKKRRIIGYMFLTLLISVTAIILVAMAGIGISSIIVSK